MLDMGFQASLDAIVGHLPPHRQTLLFRCVVEDFTAVLVAPVAELAIGHGRIDIVPVNVQQLRVADALRIIHNLHGLGVPGSAAGDFLVGGVRFAAAGIA